MAISVALHIVAPDPWISGEAQRRPRADAQRDPYTRNQADTPHGQHDGHRLLTAFFARTRLAAATGIGHLGRLPESYPGPCRQRPGCPPQSRARPTTQRSSEGPRLTTSREEADGCDTHAHHTKGPRAFLWEPDACPQSVHAPPPTLDDTLQSCEARRRVRPRPMPGDTALNRPIGGRRFRNKAPPCRHTLRFVTGGAPGTLDAVRVAAPPDNDAPTPQIVVDGPAVHGPSAPEQRPMSAEGTLAHKRLRGAPNRDSAGLAAPRPGRFRGPDQIGPSKRRQVAPAGSAREAFNALCRPQSSVLGAEDILLVASPVAALHARQRPQETQQQFIACQAAERLHARCQEKLLRCTASSGAPPIAVQAFNVRAAEEARQ